MPKYLTIILVAPLTFLLIWGFSILYQSSKRTNELREIRHQTLEAQLRYEVDNVPIDLNSKMNFRGEEAYILSDDEKTMKIYNVVTKEWREENVEKLIAATPARFIRKPKAESITPPPFQVVGRNLFVLSEDKRIMIIYDISNPTNPVKISEFEVNNKL